MIEIKIPWAGVSWLAPQLSKFRVYDKREPEKRACRLFIKNCYTGPILECPTVLKFEFYYKPPASASKKSKISMLQGKEVPRRYDCTNLQKLYEDCLKGTVIKDDKLVAEISSKKLYAEKDLIKIIIYTLEEYENSRREH